MTEVVIICNGCGKRSAPYKNAGGTKLQTVRGEMRQAGWETITNRSLDYCPDCRKKRTPETRES
jgi:hypothetical protein